MKDISKSNIPILVATTATTGTVTRSGQSVDVVTLGFWNNAGGISHPFEGVFMLVVSCAIGAGLSSRQLMIDKVYGSAKPVHFQGSPMTVGDLRGSHYLCTFDTETRIVHVIV